MKIFAFELRIRVKYGPLLGLLLIFLLCVYMSKI